MFRRPLPILLSLLSIAFLSGATSLASTRTAFVGADIPKRLFVGSPFIFQDSDSLYFDGRLLERGVQYSFKQGAGYFDLSNLTASESDTLVAIYTALPSWVATSFGRELPSATVQPQGAMPSIIPQRTALPGVGGNEIKISGSKSFRVFTQSAGTSQFNQSLDLNITGELTPGLMISGAVTDRGYNPTYGTANSRLNELEKVNIKLYSQVLSAQVGDITVNDYSDRIRPKSVSGASFALTYPNWNVSGIAARPRGQYASYGFVGQDALQGPYQIGTGQSAQPIVPGSETVWLDGRLLERGTYKDYTMDYPTGRITFNVNHAIDQASRIEIDYEPQATEYKKELFAGGGGTATNDSSVYFSVNAIREGDDREQPLFGELSDRDRALLESAGNSTATRSGVTADSTGAYILAVEYLPDSVYRYVGEGNGDFSVNFSFVGVGKGAYRFLGNDNYQYVGSDSGDYLPIVVLPAPQRVDHYQAIVGLHNKTLGRVTADIRQSQFDRNLLSSRDDNTNGGLYYQIGLDKVWQSNGGTNGVSVFRRLREARYQSRERINNADFTYDYLLPEGFIQSTDELLHRADISLSPDKRVNVKSSLSTLDYRDRFSSSTANVSAQVLPLKNITLGLGWQGIDASLDSAASSGDGAAHTYSGSARYQFTPGLSIGSAFEQDSRTKAYTDQERGTRYDRVSVDLTSFTENLRYEYYAEDTLIGSWVGDLTRNRLAAGSSRRFGAVSYDLMLTYQWLDLIDATENNLLGRLGIRYQDAIRRLSVSSTFYVSEERRNSRGITYLQVEPGQGNYSYEDSAYVPDPNGNYIQVEEILSGQARVRRGEKSFQFSKDWRVVNVRFDSRIEEELLEEGKRSVWWALPFYGDDTQPYLFFSRRYDSDVRLFPVSGFYVVNLSGGEDLQIRNIAGTNQRRRDLNGRLSLKEKIVNSHIEQGVELFKAERDAYYAASGNVDGYRLFLDLLQAVNTAEVSVGASYRRAKSSAEERSNIYALLTGSRVPLFQRGELRTDLELYKQDFSNLTGVPSYQLTGNRPGTKGVVWSMSFQYGIKSGLRVNFNLSGRHSDDRPARIYARGEVVAGF